MGRILNKIKTVGDTTTIYVTKKGDELYSHIILIDTKYKNLLTKTVYVSSLGYAFVGNVKNNLAHLIMKHSSNRITVVDHINNNRLDNREINLRVVTQHQNSTNIGTTKSNIGVCGIAKRSSGNYLYYRASVSDLADTVEICTKGGGKRTRRYAKQFNINKLGDSEALKQAKEWLQTKKIKFGYLANT